MARGDKSRLEVLREEAEQNRDAHQRPSSSNSKSSASHHSRPSTSKSELSEPTSHHSKQSSSSNQSAETHHHSSPGPSAPQSSSSHHSQTRSNSDPSDYLEPSHSHSRKPAKPPKLKDEDPYGDEDGPPLDDNLDDLGLGLEGDELAGGDEDDPDNWDKPAKGKSSRGQSGLDDEDDWDKPAPKKSSHHKVYEDDDFGGEDLDEPIVEPAHHTTEAHHHSGSHHKTQHGINDEHHSSHHHHETEVKHKPAKYEDGNDEPEEFDDRPEEDEPLTQSSRAAKNKKANDYEDGDAGLDAEDDWDKPQKSQKRSGKEDQSDIDDAGDDFIDEIDKDNNDRERDDRPQLTEADVIQIAPGQWIKNPNAKKYSKEDLSKPFPNWKPAEEARIYNELHPHKIEKAMKKVGKFLKEMVM